MNTHSFPIRVYYEDTDVAGVVYYANYLKFIERGRTEALRACGFDQSALLRDLSIGFVVRSCHIDFLKSARLDDRLTIVTRLHDIRKASMEMSQVVLREEETLVTAHVKIAAVDVNARPTRIPKAIHDAMLSFFKP